ncbi:DUF624 domain-containing protein [Mediterraneibacter sp. NSJ-55]|uniref:DUF624 domain-containing protein n=1 Tax=Mediterraneibacter hominis TaxID=2763054 RepID=A0A923RPX5_9FIRM|nr:DUF624 domain-containing protein [Mediterraneibacter hominis]MBC5688979.1 DUF624 domain-containing protein [Mediterraneibacter hominis]
MKFNITDNVVTRALSRICDFVILNILWLVCSIPIVTIGASTTALYSVMQKIVRNEEGYIARSFFKAFKQNFKQATIVWLLIAALGLILSVDLNMARSLEGTIRIVFQVIFGFFSFWLFAIFLYVFPLLARYENSTKATLKNAVILSIAKLPFTFLMMVVVVVPVAASLLTVRTILLSVPIWMGIGVSIVTWLNAYILKRVFKIFETN